MELEMKESKKLVDGQHIGIIKDVEYREKPFCYTDLIIESDGMTLKAGYPTALSEVSALGKMLKRFDIEPAIGEKIDIEKSLVGKKCSFITMTQEGKDGNMYANVIPKSVKGVE